MGKGKLFKAAATIAAIGGVCYVFRDKIKNSTVYQSLDMDDKVEKVKNTIKEKMPAKEEPERNYFSLDDAPVEGTIDQQSENTSDISEETEHSTEEAATVTEEIESPILYENEGLSDVSEDLDVIEEQDKLDV